MNGDAAFPGIDELKIFDQEAGKDIARVIPHGGMTKREVFAALALQGIIFWDATVNDRHESGKVESLAVQAVNMADALIEALKKEPKQ